MLRSVGLPEMIGSTVEDYEALALKLARGPSVLSAIKAKTGAQSRYASAIRYSAVHRHIEAAYITMWQRHRTSEPPRAFAVESIC